MNVWPVPDALTKGPNVRCRGECSPDPTSNPEQRLSTEAV